MFGRVGASRRHRAGLAASLAALACALALPGPAVGKPGSLDRGFNGDGQVVTIFPPADNPRGSVNYALPYEFAPGRIAMAQGRDGRIAVASSNAIVEYLPNGRRNPGFGGRGAVPIGPIEGARFQIADVALDSQGRVLAIGTTKPTIEKGLPGKPLAGPLPTVATVRRYLPNGQLDPGFGTGGVLDTDFGVPSPTYEGEAYEGTAVGVVGLAVDALDRPVVTGSAVTSVGRCPRSTDRYEASQAFVARLAGNGAPDPTFNGSGLRLIGQMSWVGLPASSPDGILATGLGTPPCPEGGPQRPSQIAGIRTDGALNPAFGGAGLWSHPFTRISDLAVDRSGKVVLLARTLELRRGKWVESQGQVVRLLRNGSFDRRFGRRGWSSAKPPRRGSIAALATDPKGRVLLAGSVRRKIGKGKRRRSQLRFYLTRLTRGGAVDRRFGNRGRAGAAFGFRTNARAEDVLVDRANRIAVGGKLSSPATGDGYALARFRGGR